MDKPASWFRVGDRVRIRSWEDMAAEFGLSNESIAMPYFFTPGMRPLCGRTATISGVSKGIFSLSNWSNGGGKTNWTFTSDMFEKVLTNKDIDPRVETTVEQSGNFKVGQIYVAVSNNRSSGRLLEITGINVRDQHTRIDYSFINLSDSKRRSGGGFADHISFRGSLIRIEP